MSKTDVYIELYKGQLEKFKHTQNIQWKMNISLWASILGGANFLVKYNIVLENYKKWIILISLTSLHFLWTYFIEQSLTTDKNYFVKYRNLADSSAKESANKNVKKKDKVELPIKWVFLQVLFTIMLTVFILWGIT